MSGTEQRGVCAGGKKPTARSIKQDFETFFESFKIRTAWRKDFFDTLRPPAFAGGLYMHHAFFRVRKTPTRAAIRAKGARRIKPHSKAWMATPMKAVSGAL